MRPYFLKGSGNTRRRRVFPTVAREAMLLALMAEADTQAQGFCAQSAFGALCELGNFLDWRPRL
jgi:hypothetical protein